MKSTKTGLAVLCLAWTLSGGTLAQQPAPAPPAQAPPAEEPPSPDPWPKTALSGGATYTMYQPQLDEWENQYDVAAHAAVSVLPPGSKNPVFGVIEITAKTLVSRQARTVSFKNIQVEKVDFPTVPDAASKYKAELQKILTDGPATMPLDKLEAALAVLNAHKKSEAVPVRNEPPAFVFSETPAVLITLDGDPIWVSVDGTDLQRVLNTRPLILKDSAGTIYVHILDGFLQAPSLSGSWTVAKTPPKGAAQAAQALAKKNVVDLMEGQPDEKTRKKPSLSAGTPGLVMATKPTELIVTDGKPNWTTLEGTQLLYVQNTTGSVFKEMSNQQTYVLVTGRWFSAPGFTGPWKYVRASDLPSDFANIPDDSAKENVKASVPGTPQAQEALIANEIPETAQVDRQKAKFTPQISGPVELKPIPETTLSYVANSPTPIIEVPGNTWYACQNGVWFTTASIAGPWAVATSVPAVIYSIPPSSPVHYVTYVKVYTVTPTTVVIGYTPGYMGTVVSADGIVVYGTGYTYVPYVSATVWYPPPVTYGYAASVTYTPWTGWAVGFGFGWAMAAAYYPCWGAAPYWGAMPYAYRGIAYGAYGGAAAWGPGGWAATSGNIYHQSGATSAVTRSSAGYNAWTGNAWNSKVGTSYNSVTGRASAGQQASVANAYTGNYAAGQRGASYNPNTGVTTRAGSATAGNAYTGDQSTAKWAGATGPGGQSAGVAKINDNYYAAHNGNVYKGDGSGGYQQYSNGNWNNVDHQPSTQSLQSQQAARQTGEQRSAAASSWGGGSGNWGGGSANRAVGASGGGWSRGGGGGGGSFGGFRGGGGRRR